jgi:hypothetical protein
MDKLTDILSSFFVSSSKKNEKPKETKRQENQKQQDNITRPSVVSDNVSDKKQSVVSDKQQTAVSDKKQSVVSDKQQTAVSDKKQSVVSASDVFSDKLSSDVFSDKLSSDVSLSNSILNSDLSITSDSILSSLSNEENEDVVVKKYILRPSDFYKNNILIVNDTIKDSINILSDLLYKMSLMKDVNTIYDDNIHVITSPENKKFFTKMLLENPYLYFSNFNVKKQLARKTINDLDNLEKRTIYIIDSKTLLKPLKHKDIQKIITKNVHLIIIAGEDHNVAKTYGIMGESRLLIHKLNKSKNMQKHFYKTTIKKICLSKNLSLDNYNKIINNEDYDMKYIILKNDDIRYN